MGRGPSLGREFRWLWTAYAISTTGTWLAFDALPLIAILVLGSGTAQVSLLSAVGLTVGALIAIPLAPWVEFRRKRPVMISMDVLRLAGLLSLPAAYVFGGLTFVQLLVVSVIVACGDIAFASASGAYVKALIRNEDLVTANGRLEATRWTATALGPPLGGAAIGLLGPLITVLLDAASYLLSAFVLRTIRSPESAPPARERPGLRVGEVLEGWRFVLGHRQLCLLLFNTSLVGGLILATAPLLAVLLVRDLGFALWQYGLAFGVPCVGGLIGSRLAHPLAGRFGRHRVLVVSGVLRACWPIGLAFVGPGAWGIALVIVLQFGLVTCVGVFNPVFAAYRLEHTPSDRVARTLAAWSITSRATIAALTVCWGVLAELTGPREAIALAGVLLLGTAVLLPRNLR
jgi:MFS family permease